MKYSRYPSYKDSRVEWLGDVPDNWDIKPFWTLYNRQKRTGHKGETLLSVYRDYGVIQKSSRDDNNNKASEDLSGYQLVNKSDLAMNKMKAWQGSLGVSKYKGIVSPAYFVFESLHHQYDRYLHYLMRSPRYIAGYLSMSKGIRVHQWDLDPQYHSRMPILLPSMKEQQAIANYLDKATANIDTLIEKQTRLIELLKEKRQAVISTAVTRGLDSTVAMKDSGVEWLGEIPEGWQTSRLKFLCNITTGGKDTENKVDDAEYPFYVRSQTVERIDSYSFDGEAILTAGDGAGVGKVFHYTHGKFDFHQRVYMFYTFRKVEGKFLFEYIKNNFYKVALAGMAKSTVDSLRLPLIQNFMITVPPLQEQQTIVTYLDDKTSKIDTLITKATKAIDLLKEKRTALISSAVTGKIDVRGDI